MKVLVLRGLGALPPYPPFSMLKPGHSWIRYYQKDQYGRDIATHQAFSCPDDAPFGCWLYGGYAWGQAITTTGEFQNVPTSTSTGTPSTAQISEACASAYSKWLADNPGYASCLGPEDQYQFATLCGAAWTGKLDSKTAGEQWEAYALKRCKARCAEDYNNWRAEHTRKAKCVPYDEGRSKYRYYCLKMVTGEWTKRQAKDAWNAYVDKLCAAAAPEPTPTPAPTPSPTPSPAPSPTPPDGGGIPPETTPNGTILPPIADIDDGGDHTEIIAPIEPPSSTEKKGFLRQVGPIVGIGLLIAVGVTAARYMKKGKKGQARRRR